MTVTQFIDAVEKSARENKDYEYIVRFALARAIADANPHLASPQKKIVKLVDPEVSPALREIFKEARLSIDKLKEGGLLFGEGDKSLRISAENTIEWLGIVGLAKHKIYGPFEREFIGKMDTKSPLIEAGAAVVLTEVEPHVGPHPTGKTNFIVLEGGELPKSGEFLKDPHDESLSRLMSVKGHIFGYDLTKLFAYALVNEKGRSAA